MTLLREDVLKVLGKYSGYNSLNVFNIDHFFQTTKKKIAYLKSKANKMEIGLPLLEYYEHRFDKSFYRLKEYFEKKTNDQEDPYVDFFNKKHYLNYIDDLLYLGIWDDGFVNGQQSSLGSLFLPIQKYKMNRPIGILQAAIQQLSHNDWENLNKAQKLATEIYTTFMGNVNGEKDKDHHDHAQFPPIVQLYNGDSSAILTGLPSPAFILFDKKHAHDFESFAALPHECGHVLAHTHQGSELLKEIRNKIKGEFNINRPKIYLRKEWDKWLEECFADAIAVATIKEGEVFSLENLFSDKRTNKIYKNHDGDNIDEHPNPFIRVLLTIEICVELGILRKFTLDEEKVLLVDQLKNEWQKIGEEINTDYPDEHIMNLYKKRYHLKENFANAIPIVARCLINTPYITTKGQSLKTIFATLNKKLARQLRGKIIANLSKKPTLNFMKRTFGI
jgi:hypothetical protein